MGKAKKDVIELIKQFPETSTLEDIQYHIYAREKVERGLRNLAAGRILSQKEVERLRFKKISAVRLSSTISI